MDYWYNSSQDVCWLLLQVSRRQCIEQWPVICNYVQKQFLRLINVQLFLLNMLTVDWFENFLEENNKFIASSASHHLHHLSIASSLFQFLPWLCWVEYIAFDIVCAWMALASCSVKVPFFLSLLNFFFFFFFAESNSSPHKYKCCSLHKCSFVSNFYDYWWLMITSS